MTEQWKKNQNPKGQNHGTAENPPETEWQEITRNPKWQNYNYSVYSCLS